MKDSTPKAIKLQDYHRPDYLIPRIDLNFDLNEEATVVTSHLKIKKNYPDAESPRPLVLNGEQLLLKTIKLNGKELDSSQYSLSPEHLIIPQVPVPGEFTLEIENQINPMANKALEGLYKSGDVFCTQNEPEGFRRITYFIDRSDVMSRYTTRIEADKKKYPVLLSNGNEVERGELAGGRHFVKWEDPFPKPCYLFALVAGDLGLVRSEFTTMSKRAIDLRLYCDKGNEEKCHFAMESLKKAMKWDEEIFGLEYDLDIYMIVAVDAFNMGAMENKGLNIFNTSCVLSNPKTATDADFQRVEGVVAHEYFHNWTGNRVTCRDWFQLTLKEGLTVFRDQEFSADMTSRAVQRIQDVRVLRNGQFPEDAGPMAHPIRPDSYIEINNFYTRTVYEKGAEVIRMIHTLLGAETFRKGMDEYFKLYDGQAVTTDDFVYAMEKASGIDLGRFKRWYSQAGTPELTVSSDYNSANKTYTLKVIQSCPDTPGQSQSEKKPFYFPLTIGLLDHSGQDLPVKNKVLVVSEKEQEFVFQNISERPIPSINRNFSAPIKVKMESALEDLMFLLSYDSDPFNRWEAGQQLSTVIFHSLVKDQLAGKTLALNKDYLEAFRKLLEDESIDPAFKAVTLILPEENLFHEDFNPIPIKEIHEVREFMIKELGKIHYSLLMDLYRKLHACRGINLDQRSMGERDLKNICLSYLMRTGDSEATLLCFDQWKTAVNMTEEISALREMVALEGELPLKDQALEGFYQKWKHDNLVITKWFAVQGASRSPRTLERVKELVKDPAFNLFIPNFTKALLGQYANNHVRFHDVEGKSYEWFTDKILEIDPMNPQLASILSSSFNKFAKLDQRRKQLMKTQLERIFKVEGLSKNVFEIVSKNLQLEQKGG